MYEYLAPDGKRYPADLLTLQEWARSGRIRPDSLLLHRDTGMRTTAGQLVPLQPHFGARFAAAPVSTFATPAKKPMGSGKIIAITLAAVFAIPFLIFTFGVMTGITSGVSGKAISPGIPTVERVPSSMPSSLPVATLVQSRLVPFQTASGEAAQMVLIDWKNTGSTPVRKVYATIMPRDAAGHVLGSGAEDYTIYATTPENRGIAPGQTYREPEGEGFVLLPAFGNAAKVSVTITRVSETGL